MRQLPKSDDNQKWMPPVGNEGGLVVREGENILERRRALGLGTTDRRGHVGSWLHCLYFSTLVQFCWIVGLVGGATVENGELGGVRSWHS